MLLLNYKKQRAIFNLVVSFLYIPNINGKLKFCDCCKRIGDTIFLEVLSETPLGTDGVCLCTVLGPVKNCL